MRFLGHISRYMSRYKRAYAVGLFLVLGATLLAIATPLIFKTAIDALEAGRVGFAIGQVSLALAAIAAVRAALSFKGRYTIVSTSRLIEHDLRQELYAKLMRLPARFFDENPSGDLESRVVNDVESIRMVAGVATMMMVTSGLLFALSLVSMFWINAKLASWTIVPLLLISILTSLLTRIIYRQSEAVQERLGELTTIAQENFSGARVIRAFAQEENEDKKFAAASGAYRNANLRLATTRGLTWGMMEILIEATIGVTLLFGGLGIMDGSLSKGEFVAFTAYQFMLAWPVIAMGWVITLIQRGAACMERIRAVLTLPEQQEPARGPSGPARGEIEIRNLSFRYSENLPNAVEGISLKIRPGERVAIVGRTGAGKSTLVNILLGLYRAPEGTVFLDGHDINEYPAAALREIMGSVSQDTFLFSDTLAFNIAFGSRDPEPAREAILQAAEDSRISKDLGAFPNGIEQIIGGRGITLSGGQKQRTAIARALARRPSVLLLDDALSSVDVGTEREILERLDRFMKGRTCLIVTHRLSIVSHIDRIIVMDAGKIVQAGTHGELLKQDGLYAQLARRQRLEEAIEDQ